MTAAIIHTKREQWLIGRRESIGASEAAAVLGFDPRRDALSVYAEKIGVLEVEETPWMRWGRRVEDAIALGYADETKRPVIDEGGLHISRHPDIPWLGATLDRITEGIEETPAPCAGKGPLEIKAVGAFSRQDWRDEPPTHYQIQLQVQMACTGAEWGSLCALIGGLSLAWADLKRDDRFLAVALPKLEAFWRCVRLREPPVVDRAKSATWDALNALWPDDNGEAIALPGDTLQLVSEWEAHKEQRKQAEQHADDLEVVLRERMGSAAVGMLADGTSLSLKKQERAGYTRTVPPTSFRVLRRFRPRG